MCCRIPEALYWTSRDIADGILYNRAPLFRLIQEACTSLYPFLYFNCDHVCVFLKSCSIVVYCTYDLAERQIKRPTLLVIDEAPWIYLIMISCAIAITPWIYFDIMCYTIAIAPWTAKQDKAPYSGAMGALGYCSLLQRKPISSLMQLLTVMRGWGGQHGNIVQCQWDVSTITNETSKHQRSGRPTQHCGRYSFLLLTSP